MKRRLSLPAALFFVAAAAMAAAGCGGKQSGVHSHQPHRSQYADGDNGAIKALSADDAAGLEAGAGTPFGGMARAAELNGYPGPRHVLDAAAELSLSGEQREQIQLLYEQMRGEAVVIGKKILAAEKELDESFKNKTITQKLLREKTRQSAEWYGKLRAVHLLYHLHTARLLTAEQTAEYNRLRGYTTGDACVKVAKVPAGHSAALWKLHNDCE